MNKELLIKKIEENENVLDFYALKVEILKHLKGQDKQQKTKKRGDKV